MPNGLSGHCIRLGRPGTREQRCTFGEVSTVSHCSHRAVSATNWSDLLWTPKGATGASYTGSQPHRLAAHVNVLADRAVVPHWSSLCAVTCENLGGRFSQQYNPYKGLPNGRDMVFRHRPAIVILKRSFDADAMRRCNAHQHALHAPSHLGLHTICCRCSQATPMPESEQRKASLARLARLQRLLTIMSMLLWFALCCDCHCCRSASIMRQSSSGVKLQTPDFSSPRQIH